MNRLFIDLIGTSQSLKIFLTKSYGLELLFTLDEHQNRSIMVSMILMKCILYYETKHAAFYQFCSILRDRGVIEYAPSTNKKSKQILRLSEGSIQQLSDVRIQFAETVAP